jgi:YHS domain-containing protein
MKPEFVRCEFCRMKIPMEGCRLAAHHTVIDGREYVFCCTKCADRYQRKTKK